jgi:hypothetical protein
MRWRDVLVACNNWQEEGETKGNVFVDLTLTLTLPITTTRNIVRFRLNTSEGQKKVSERHYGLHCDVYDLTQGVGLTRCLSTNSLAMFDPLQRTARTTNAQ